MKYMRHLNGPYMIGIPIGWMKGNGLNTDRMVRRQTMIKVVIEIICLKPALGVFLDGKRTRVLRMIIH
jgi:hypothetical protein